METGTESWKPLSPDEVWALLKDICIPYWIAGGWAIDLFIGHQTRSHGDVDILILRRDQAVLYDYLSYWKLYKTKQPGLAVWAQDEYLEAPVNDIWCRKDIDKPWSMQFMLMETDGDQWVYRREPRIRGDISSLGIQTDNGLPYLRPEIQLLYKSILKSPQKDQHDFDLVAPQLSAGSRRWLYRALELQYPAGHIWINRLKEKGR